MYDIFKMNEEYKKGLERVKEVQGEEALSQIMEIFRENDFTFSQVKAIIGYLDIHTDMSMLLSKVNDACPKP